MASQLILDRTDPGVDELVSQWKDGGEYEISVKIRQDASSESVGNYTVLTIESEDAGMEDEMEEEPMEEEVMKKPIPAKETEE